MPTSTISNPNSTPRPDTDGDAIATDKDLTRNLLTMKKSLAATTMRKLWEAQENYFDRRFATWKVNVLRHMGYHNVSLQSDGNKWDYYIPPNASPDNIPMISKLAEILRKLSSIMFSDPPAPHVEPAAWTDDEVYAAEIAKRVLEDVDSESMLNEVTQFRRAFMKASDYGSGFIYYYVDPTGGPVSPVQIEAHPAAETVQHALTHPETGKPLPPPYTRRYVGPDGKLSERRRDAKFRPLPALKSRVLTGRNVRFVPHNAADIWDADGVLIGEFITWGRMKNLFEELRKLPDDVEDQILSYRPPRAEDIASWDQDLNVGTNNKDERLVWVMTAYYKRTALYPNGARIITVGGRRVVFRGEWKTDLPDGTTEVLDIPLTQITHWNEGREDGYGVGSTEILGRADEFLATQYAMIIEHLDRLNHRKIFVDVHSIINESDLYRRDKRIIRTQGDRPVYEDVPPISRDVLAAYVQTEENMENALGLGDTAQGLEAPSVKSGRHALAIVQQAQAALSEPRQNIERAYTRAGRIKLQLVRKYFKQPREAGWTTEDDEYRLDSWSRVDLGNARDVRVRPGTLTMLTPVAKAQLAEHYYTLGILDQFRMYDIFAGNLGGTLGLEDDPNRLRIRRQIAEWKNGPPEEWQPQEPQQQLDPTTGQPIMVNPVDPVLEKIWEPVPADYLPPVAQVRINELAKLMASKKYVMKPQQWRARVEQEFQALLQAVAPAPTQAGPTPEQANEAGSPLSQTQASDQAGLTDTADAPGQRPSPGTEL